MILADWEDSLYSTPRAVPWGRSLSGAGGATRSTAADLPSSSNEAGQGWTALHAMTWGADADFGLQPPGPVTTGAMDSLTFARALVERGADVDARMTAEPRNGYRNALNRIGATPRRRLDPPAHRPGRLPHRHLSRRPRTLRPSSRI